ncbi:RNA-guided endonuclease InsQ/TnpB family protein [Nocardia sp. NPDC058519]|uniref:RNA-guided endonuclease InsQ/TnpB family protein n=1 Tax=Nocardia sp. NPDC058519 TaxID=3346535 RepID=UPI00364826BE
MQLRYNFRLYPTVGQRQSLAQAFGCARVVFNDALAIRQQAYRDGHRVTDAELSKLLTESKKTPERVWLSGVSAVVLQQALADLNTAYRNFFGSVTGTRKGPKIAAPRFRSRRDNRQAIRFTRNARFAVTAGEKLRLPKIGDVRVAWSRRLPSVPSSVTVIKDAAGRYFASFVVEVGTRPLPEVDAEVGIDLGLTSFAVLSDGRVIENPRLFRRAERKLRKAQQALSRKQKGSSNRGKARIRVARAHAKVADQRRDFVHKLSTTIVRDNQAVFVEDLCVKGLARTRLAKSVHDAGWSMFTRLVGEKAVRHGRFFAKVDRFFPSSQLCSACGVVGGKKPLHVRWWTCGCGIIHDRDVNAAKNVLAAGQAERLNACGVRVSPELVPALRGEAGTRRKRFGALVGVSVL